MPQMLDRKESCGVYCCYLQRTAEIVSNFI